jgi:hypothetical protein
MKHIYKYLGIIALMALIGLLTISCNSALQLDKLPTPEGKGSVIISINNGARTILPSEFKQLYYRVEFSNGEDTVEDSFDDEDSSVILELEVGEWNVSVTAHVDEEGISPAVLAYSDTVSIVDGENPPINAELEFTGISNMDQTPGVKGYLAYDITLPSGAAGTMRVLELDGEEVESVTLNQTTANGEIELDSGEYNIDISIIHNNKEMTWWNLAHIYDGAISKAAVLAGDFSFTIENLNKTLEYELINNGTAYSVIDYTGPGGDVIIPAEYMGLPITEIGDEAFYYSYLTSVEIPDSVTNIGSWVFAGNQLESVTIPSSVTDIGNEAFYNNNLTSVEIPDSVTYVGSYAFESNELESVDIGDGISTLEYGVFRYNLLESVIIPESVSYIGGEAFAYNPVIEITIGADLEIEENAFDYGFAAYYDNEGQEADTYTRPDADTFWGSNTFGDFQYIGTTEITIVAYTGLGGDVIIPPDFNGIPVTAIGNEAFYQKGLTSVDIPESVTSIGDYAFDNNPLISIDIGAEVALEDNSFPNDFAAYYEEEDQQAAIYTRIDELSMWGFGVFGDFDYRGTSKITIMGYNGPSGAVEIPAMINEKPVTTIDTDVFMNRGLTSVDIPDSVITIGDGAFIDNQLQNVELPTGLTTIGIYAFSGNQLESITIPAAVTLIGEYAFESNQLSSVQILADLSTIEEGVFVDNQLTIVEIPEGVIDIGEIAFGYNQLESVTIPDSVEYIGSEAFTNNPLTSITIGAGVTIDEDAFDGGFAVHYDNEGQRADTYTRSSPTLDWGSSNPGHIEITLSWEQFEMDMSDEGEGVFNTDEILLDKSLNSTVTVWADWGDVIEWYLGANSLSSQDSVTLYAEDFDVGFYTLNLVFENGGKTWLGDIRFEVVE